MRYPALLFALFIAISGCTVRNSTTKLTPQLTSSGDLVYMYSDIASFAQPDLDESAESNRLRDLNDWVLDANLCKNGYEIIKRKAISIRSALGSKNIYYFIRCKP